MEQNNDNVQGKPARGRTFFKRSSLSNEQKTTNLSGEGKDERLSRAVKPKKIERRPDSAKPKVEGRTKTEGAKPKVGGTRDFKRDSRKPNERSDFKRTDSKRTDTRRSDGKREDTRSDSRNDSRNDSRRDTRNSESRNSSRSSSRGGRNQGGRGFADKYDNGDRNERGERINRDGKVMRSSNRTGERRTSTYVERPAREEKPQGRLPYVKQEQLGYTQPKALSFDTDTILFAGEEPETNVGGKKKRSSSKGVKIVFLGGVGEIGKNMTAIECGNDIIIIDAGAIFPTDETPGFDLIVPDITYLKANAKKIRALFITHGHEDHIGGIPYLLKELKVPVVGTKLTLALVDNKLREHRLNDTKEICVEPGQEVSFGCFSVKCVNVNHSIAGALAYAITTPQGVIFHSGDYKIDLTPVAGEPIDLKTIGDIGAKGVLLYLGESTNIERAGYTMSELTVGNTIDKLFTENSKRRIIIATFASNVHRLQQIIDIAAKHNRKVALSGRSMLNVSEAAEKIGELVIPKNVVVDVAKIKNMRDDEIVVVCTGSQGEPMSALTRMANNNYPNVQIGENDTVIVSASPIPGNEKLVYRVINNLYRLGADVVYESISNIHVSGHACREEHKIMHTLLKPKYFIPVHGEYRHLKKHAQLAEELGMPTSHVMIADIGNCIEVTQKGLKRLDNIPSGSRLIDGEGIEDEKQSVVVEDRRHLSEEGLFIVSIAVSGGEVVGEIAINSRGFVFDFHRDYIKEMREVIRRAIEGYNLSSGSVDELKRVIKHSLRNYLLRKTKQSPMVVPVVVEI